MNNEHHKTYASPSDDTSNLTRLDSTDAAVIEAHVRNKGTGFEVNYLKSYPHFPSEVSRKEEADIIPLHIGRAT